MSITEERTASVDVLCIKQYHVLINYLFSRIEFTYYSESPQASILDFSRASLKRLNCIKI